MYAYTAFEGLKCISSGSLEKVALDVKRKHKNILKNAILIFSDYSGVQIDLDLSGSEKDVLSRLKIFAEIETPTQPTVGRPKLGVVPREVSLLPKHWEWLNNQSGGASAVIRNLIDEKIKKNQIGKERIKHSQEATYKMLSALAGNLANFEEVIRFLYRKDQSNFEKMMENWPKDIVKYANKISSDVFKELD